ncbi:hypothetical protein [Candidatus Formimonas warabiya]|uniref:Uncharacterized protein n=1 Tax=Formimonas warabiya TaxID=1761012 RepID=A0A3G1KQY0_FORW1|nr:hypothetical protein [Candidatus Formimonas warabiya]ATW24850.1 hypothetical protein DCMF_08750 [Candidatus Formimonas warabiya]
MTHDVVGQSIKRKDAIAKVTILDVIWGILFIWQGGFLSCAYEQKTEKNIFFFLFIMVHLYKGSY